MDSEAGSLSNGDGDRDVGRCRSRCAVEDHLSSFKGERRVASFGGNGARVVGRIEYAAAESELVPYVTSEEVKAPPPVLTANPISASRLRLRLSHNQGCDEWIFTVG